MLELNICASDVSYLKHSAFWIYFILLDWISVSSNIHPEWTPLFHDVASSVALFYLPMNWLVGILQGKWQRLCQLLVTSYSQGVTTADSSTDIYAGCPSWHNPKGFSVSSQDQIRSKVSKIKLIVHFLSKSVNHDTVLNVSFFCPNMKHIHFLSGVIR